MSRIPRKKRITPAHRNRRLSPLIGRPWGKPSHRTRLKNSSNENAMDTREFEVYWESVKASFLKTWINGFEALLGWPESRTLEWASKWRDAFEAKDEGRIFFHW